MSNRDLTAWAGRTEFMLGSADWRSKAADLTQGDAGVVKPVGSNASGSADG